MHQITELIVRSETRTRLCSLFVVLALAALPLSADVLVTTFPSTTSTGDGYGTGGSAESGNAVSFVVGSAYSLTQIQLEDNFFTAATDGGIYSNLNVGLWQNTTDSPNGATELEAWTVLPLSPAQTAELITLTPSSSTTPSVIPDFNSSDFYFITETVIPDPTAGATQGDWGWQANNQTPTPATGNLFSEFGGMPWFPEGSTAVTPSFSVSGNAISSTVPEPRSYAALLGAALVGVLLLRRRKVAA
jgi:hypothetical protein